MIRKTARGTRSQRRQQAEDHASATPREPGEPNGFLTSPARLSILDVIMRTTIITIQRSFIILGLTLAAVLTSCSGLPDYARPRGGVQLDDPAMLSDAFTYRRLTRSDFRAKSQDTSLFYSPRWQRWWQEKVDRQLADSQPAAVTAVSGNNTGSSEPAR
jgi:hypothetical protein